MVGKRENGKQLSDILVLVVGVTPQIITETIYALSQQDQPVHIDDLYIITTSVGKRKTEEALAVGKILAPGGRGQVCPVFLRG